MNESSHERQLEAILHAYLQDVDAGKQPDRQELLRQHPVLAGELREFFADRMVRLWDLPFIQSELAKLKLDW